MANITRDQIAALQMEEGPRNELLSLFDDILGKEKEIADLRAKAPTDSQQIVEKTDFAKFQAATKELEALKQTMAEKMAVGPTGEYALSAFAQFFGE